MADICDSEKPAITDEAFMRGILDGVISSGLDFRAASSEHEVKNIVLDALGRDVMALPEPWEYQPVIEFADGGAVVLVDEDEERASKILNQEIARRRKQKLPLDCYMRRRRAGDQLVTYIHPAPTRAGRKRKQTIQFGEWTDGAGI